FVRSLDQFNGPPLQLERIRPTSVFFSPTGHAAAFMAPDQVLRKITLADGLVVTLVRDTDFTSGGAWGSDDRITFVREGALWQIAASGGTPQRLTTLDTNQHEVLHGWPASLPGGKVVLFACVTDRGRTASRIEAVTVATGRRRVLIESGTFPMYAASGHLIFYRDRALLAVPFNVDRLETTVAPVRVLDAVPIALTGSPLAALSETGTLVYAPIGSTTGRLVSVSRQGIEQTRTEPASSYASPRISADGRRVVATMAGDLWIHDTARATSTRLTAEEGAETYNSFPIWTPDAKRIVFRSRSGLRVINADGTGRSEVIPGTSISDYPTSVSPDGETLAFARILADTASDVYVLSLHGDPKPRAVVSTPAYAGGPAFSPNGHWIAYASDESGQMQVYVRPYPRTDRKWQVSTQGGTQPQWNSNGQELFYRDGNKLMAVDVTGSDSLTLSQPHVLFERDFGNA